VKDARAPVAHDAPLADRATMVFTGTTVIRGKGRAVVTATGIRTELGRFGRQVSGYSFEHLLPENGRRLDPGLRRGDELARRDANV